ncbi:MAG: lytic transglycosylase domain-containing protein [Acetobacteraceae bacterium]
MPPRVLPSIQMVEGGRVGTVSSNTDGSADLGVMQINTRWIAPLARRTGSPEELVRHRLINEPCYNIAAAGAIMRIYLNEENGDLLRAVGNYHSHTPARNRAYQEKVLQAARSLFSPPAAGSPRRPPHRRRFSRRQFQRRRFRRRQFQRRQFQRRQFQR